MPTVRRHKRKLSKRARKFISRHTRHHIKDLGMPKKQAVRVSYKEARMKGLKVPRMSSKKL